MREAGRLTAGYLLANRIPGPVQMVMKLLPAPLAARMLVSAIRSHAWTFAGSGRFSARNGRSTVFEIRDNPLCRGEWAPGPVCAWHTAVFQRLFEVLVSPNSRAVETHCEANGDPCCRFVIDRGAGGMAG
jgi:divinyl protochlorophyllide a 8-vinyl-reductase